MSTIKDDKPVNREAILAPQSDAAVVAKPSPGKGSKTWTPSNPETGSLQMVCCF